MVYLMNVLALLCWLIPVILVFYYSYTRRKGKVICSIAALCMFFLIWFYYPQKTQFPADDFAPVYMWLVTPDEPSLKCDKAVEQSPEILALCNEIYASRSIKRTLFNRHCEIMGADLYIYFSGKGENWSKTCLALDDYGRRNTMVKNKQFYRLWNSDALYQQICNVMGVDAAS